MLEIANTDAVIPNPFTQKEEQPRFDAVQQLIDRRPVTRCPKGKTLFREDEPARFSYYVLSGTVKLSRYIESGDEVLIDLIDGGRWVGLEQIANCGDQGFHAEVVTAGAEVVAVPNDEVCRLMGRSPETALQITALVSEAMERLEQHIEFLKTRTGTQRVAEYIRGRCGSRNGAQVVDLPCDKLLLARFLGLQPESFSRCLSKLKRLGVTGKYGKGILVNDASRLAS